MKKRLIMLTGLIILLAASMAALTAGVLAAPNYIWSMDSEDEISNYGDDNTGSAFALDTALFVQGTGSCKVIPTGEAPETKLALDLEGKDLESWLGHDSLALNLYIPQDMSVKPNTFFLGMADVTSDWKWVDGLFSKTEVKAGWNKVVYILNDPMKEISEDGRYKIYFSFFATAADGGKPPLEGAFNIDGIWME